MKAGKLRHLIDIQARTLTPDAHGGRERDWHEDEPFAKGIWASVEPLSGSEQWRARQVQASTTHKVTIRYLAGVTSKMRVKFGSRYLLIESVKDDEERHWEMILMCTEQT